MRRTAGLLVAMLAAAGALAGEWQMQGDGQLLFEATWEGAAVPGRFHDFEVRLDTVDGDIAGATLTVTVKLDSADMDDPDINEAIAGAEWFAVSEHPVATYTSESIEAGADGGYVAEGYLDLKGVRLPVSVPFQWSESDGRAQMRGELVIDRTRFDVGSGEWATAEPIGMDVRVSFNVVVEQQ
jgi:polyisoprenoid-binding protein YceI